jgi:hypothetical protein
MPTINTVAFNFEQLSASDKPQKLTESLFLSRDGQAEKAFITCEGFIRYRYDGEEPTEQSGHVLNDGGFIYLSGLLQIQNFRFIGSGVIAISYERQ